MSMYSDRYGRGNPYADEPSSAVASLLNLSNQSRWNDIDTNKTVEMSDLIMILRILKIWN